MNEFFVIKVLFSSAIGYFFDFVIDYFCVMIFLIFILFFNSALNFFQFILLFILGGLYSVGESLMLSSCRLWSENKSLWLDMI